MAAQLFPPYPVFLDLMGRAVVLLGGGEDVANIARAALEAGAGMRVFTPEPCADILALEPGLRLARRRWRSADLRGAALVVAGRGETRAQRARLAAKSVQAIFHAVDAQNLSDIALGGALLRGPIAIGMTAEALPAALHRAIHARVAEALPPRLSGFFEAAAALREEIAARIADAEQEAAFWRASSDAAFTASPGDWRAWLLARLPARAP